MASYSTKAQKLLPTFLIIIISSLWVIVILFWALSIKTSIIDPNSAFWTIFVAFLFPIIPLWLILRPKLELLKFKPQHRGKFVFHLVTYFTLIPAIMISVFIADSEFGKLTTVSSINELLDFPETRYYSVKDYFIDTTYFGYYYDWDYDHDGPSVDVYVYITLPMFMDHHALNNPRDINYWYAFQEHRGFNAKATYEEDEIKVKELVSDCLKSIREFPYDSTRFFRRIKSKDTYYYKAVEASFGKPTSEELVLLLPEQVIFENRSNNAWNWLIFTISMGFIIFSLLLLWPDLYS